MSKKTTVGKGIIGVKGKDKAPKELENEMKLMKKHFGTEKYLLIKWNEKDHQVTGSGMNRMEILQVLAELTVNLTAK